MRRFRRDHEGIIPDSALLALWKGDEVSSSTGMLDSSASASYSMTSTGGAASGSLPAGCTAYYNTTDATNVIIGGKFDTLKDLSGNGRDRQQTTDANRYVVATVNGKQVAQASGSQFMPEATGANLSSYVSAGAKTILLRVQATTITANQTNSYDNQAIFQDQGAFCGVLVKNPSVGNYTLIFDTWDGADKNINTPISLNTWLDVVCRHDGVNLNLTVNGTVVASVAAGNTLTMTGAVPLTEKWVSSLGANFVGYVQAIATWQRVLSDAEVTNWQNLVSGATGNTTQGSIFAGGQTGARTAGGGGNWFAQSGSSSAHFYLTTDWSVSMWTQLASASSAGTVALMEYSTGTAMTAGTLCPLGLYHTNANQLRLVQDLSTSSANYSIDFQTPYDGNPHHFVLTKDTSVSSGPVGMALFTLYVDGQARTSTVAYTTNGSGSANSSSWIVGGSKRFGSAASPGLMPTSLTIDDIGFFKRPLSAQQVQSIYGAGARSWNERRLFESQTYQTRYRVLVADTNGVMTDLSNLYGVDWVRTVDVKEAVDTPINQATVKLLRYVGPALNMSPFVAGSVLNVNAAAGALLDLRRRIRVEVAIVPAEWNLNGYEWDAVFDGYTDKIAWETDSVTIDCIDKMAPLKDTFQLDPIVHDYYGSQTLSETHIQTCINENVPKLNTGQTVLTFGYTGGTPTLYTPASSGWVLNYDDSASGTVDTIIQAVADQIGWDCRFQYYWPWSEYRLTYYAPPRTMSYDIQSVTTASGGYTLVTTTQPHRLIEDQAVTISGASVFNATDTIQAIPYANQFITYTTPSSGGITINGAGAVAYSTSYSLADTQVQSYAAIERDTDKIRNAFIVKYMRNSDSATLPVTSVLSTGSGVFVTIAASASYAPVLQWLISGQEFTITSCRTTVLNATYTVGSIAANVITANEAPSFAASDTTAAFASDYMTFKQTFSCNTTSIARYGYRAAAMYEGSNGNIDTDREALALANAVVNDLAEPTADMSLKIRPAPWFELHDTITLLPDQKARWDSNLNAAIVGVDHHFELDKSYTQLTLRNSTPTLGTAWGDRIRINPQQGRPSYPNVNKIETDDATVVSSFKNSRGQSIGGRHQPHYRRGRGNHRRMRQDITEVHISTSSAGFNVSDSTLVHAGRDETWDIHLDSTGTPITPGQTYFVRTRFRDVFGNLSLPTVATTAVARFNDKPPAALIQCENSITVQFRPGNWGIVPFNFSSYDNYSNVVQLAADPVGAVTAAFWTASPVTGVFQMPCSGICHIESRVGVINNGIDKATMGVDFGIIRAGSSLPGGNASTPVAKNAGYVVGTATGFQTITVASNVLHGTYMQMHASVSANSGDYLGIGILTDTNGCFMSNNAGSSLPYVSFFVTQR